MSNIYKVNRLYFLRGLFVSLFVMIMSVPALAQTVRGVVVDADTGDSLSYVSVKYKGSHVSTITDGWGRFSIARHKGMYINFTSVGYKSKSVYIGDKNNNIVVKLKPAANDLSEVVVRSKSSRYSRKENPAVELMRRVIAKKQQTKLENKDFYQYRNYERLTIALNDISQATLDSGSYSRKPWLKEQVEKSPYTGKNVLPVITTEKIFHKYYRKDPKKERIYVDAEHSTGVNDLIETGDIFTKMASDVFSEVDIYDDQVRLLQYPFTSPIGRDAISFYRFYIVDTLDVKGDSCIQVSFLPNNQQDFGFRGDLWIIKDSTLHVKKVHLSIPKRSDVNFVHNMAIDQEYLKLPSGDWVLNVNDMLVELALIGERTGDFQITRTSRRNDYSFEPIEEKIFRGKALEKRDPYSEMRDKEYWEDNREVALTSGEEGMDKFIKGMKSTKGFGWLLVGLKAVMENYIETTKDPNPSKFDIGPVNSMISTNSIDGFRFRLSGQTTGNLNHHIFLKGYMAHGFKTNNNYYGATVTYSFNKKQYTPDEFPRRNISFTSTYDICSPSDKFLNVDKDNVFASIRWSKVMNMAYYKRQTLDFEREEDWGFAIAGGIRTERQEAAGDLFFKKFSDPNFVVTDDDRGAFRFTEVYLQVSYSPGQTYINSKQKRSPANRDSPIFKLKHTMGIKGLLGGQYNYHVTEASIYYRQWLKSWGKLDLYLKGGRQWSQVPFPLLIAPAANISYIWQRETFELINNMEFLNDKYVSLMMEWDLNGKIFNRIPFLKELQWRELIGFNVLYGGLSDKNNPAVAAAQGIDISNLMEFPERAYVMNTHVPYCELRVGIHNIFKLLQIEYVHRFNYLNLPTASKNGVRFGFRLTF